MLRFSLLHLFEVIAHAFDISGSNLNSRRIIEGSYEHNLGRQLSLMYCQKPILMKTAYLQELI